MKTAAMAWGDWALALARAREGLACLRFLEADENEIVAERLEAASDDFREQRNLIAAEEMTRWLESRGLDADEWVAFVERSLARERCVADMGEIVATYPVDEDEVGAVVECESLCSGIAEAVAWKLAAVASFSAGEGALEAAAPDRDAEDERRAHIKRLAALFDALRARAVTEEGIARMIEIHRLDWTTLECRMVAFRDEDAAREAALCVLEEGDDLAKVAVDAGTRLDESRFLLEDIPGELQPRVLSAEQGKLVGPIPFGGRPTLLIVVAKRAPDAGDVNVRARAERALLQTAIEQHTRGVRFELAVTGR